ncbi:MAG: DUF839 domain-containing protein [Candidatus Solibacter usitatus]|nr:DUF839 domain-containing protein [Candidatus Solibacter usitatus]
MSSRRSFLLSSGAAISAGFGGLKTAYSQTTCPNPQAGYGELQREPLGIIELPRGFQYDMFSTSGDFMDDGFRLPSNHDSMGAFAGPDGTALIVRNHEMSNGAVTAGPYLGNRGLYDNLPKSKIYDGGNGVSPALGGTTNFIYDTKSHRLQKQWLSLTGTMRNCSGGVTPWGTWVSCEESAQRATGFFEKDHGYCFEVPVSSRVELADPVPLIGMGRFNHEAVAVHERSGIVYETEDRGDSLFYRFLPNKKGALAEGGVLQALAIRGRAGYDTRNYTTRALAVNTVLDVEWVTLEEVESPGDNLRAQGFAKGAALFSRGEGMWATPEFIYFVCTDGGPARGGQIFRYVPSPFEGQPLERRYPGRLELFIEPNNLAIFENGDNMTVSPWGDLFVCEDGAGGNSVVGVTPDGEVYPFLRNIANASEFAGGVFSLDGSTFFVNIQTPGVTIAVWGPWRRSVCDPMV